MIITTTSSIDGKRIKEYKGIITGEAILGANIFRDMFAAVRDIGRLNLAQMPLWVSTSITKPLARPMA
jgi:uncharacterized protein YbjQ (UPF0145 family)